MSSSSLSLFVFLRLALFFDFDGVLFDRLFDFLFAALPGFPLVVFLVFLFGVSTSDSALLDERVDLERRVDFATL
jgi:hypothetical protein